jgi:protein-ribulosamine 3-kinase
MVRNEWKEKIEQFLNLKVLSFDNITNSVSGQTYHIKTNQGSNFIKIAASNLLESELHGLTTIADSSTVRTPQVFGITPVHSDYSALILEYIQSDTPTFNITTEKNIAHTITELHKVKGDQFGLDRDNHIGALKQVNALKTSWSQFFISTRLEYMWDQAITEKSVPPEWTIHYTSYLNKLSDHLDSIHVIPTLLHGDLWSGNMLFEEENNPVLIDPAIYYGHGEVDLAMMDLFGGFSNRVFDEYQSSFEIPDGFEFRKKAYQLYYLLVHVRLFGSAYLKPVYETITTY